MRLQEKTAVITGAAAGQGRHIGAVFAREGARVMLIDVDEAGGESAAAAIREEGGEALFRRCDVASEQDWEAAATATLDHFGGIDILYNNAALFHPEDGSVLDLDTATWDRVMAVNVRGVFLGCKHMAPPMVAAGAGSIINVASIRAYLGTSVPQDAYAASKGAVVAMTKSMAVHLAPQGVRVNVICPGTILTDMAPVKDEAAARRRIARYPLGRFGLSEDVAGAAVYLASEEASWTTGVSLAIDGGTSPFYV